LAKEVVLFLSPPVFRILSLLFRRKSGKKLSLTSLMRVWGFNSLITVKFVPIIKLPILEGTLPLPLPYPKFSPTDN